MSTRRAYWISVSWYWQNQPISKDFFLRSLFSCPECDKTFNCPANLASHRRWHKPQPSNGSALPSTSTPKSVPSKHPRYSSRSDSRSTNTSSSTTTSDTVHEYPTLSATTSSTIDLSKKDSLMINEIQQKTSSDQLFRAMFNGNSPRMISPSLSNSYLKQPMLFPHSRSLPMSIPSSFDFRRLQSSCIFCHEQFSELNHLFQHIRKNHAVTSSTNSKNINLALDKIVFWNPRRNFSRDVMNLFFFAFCMLHFTVLCCLHVI